MILRFDVMGDFGFGGGLEALDGDKKTRSFLELIRKGLRFVVALRGLG